MERAIDFLLKSQANLEQRIEQVNSNLGARIEELAAHVEDLAAHVEDLAARVEDVTGRVVEVGGLLGELAQTQNQFIETVTRTFEAQAEFNRRTDERINALVGVVERLVSDRQNGMG
jgi:methyl-accepting chemotaxis protein